MRSDEGCGARSAEVFDFGHQAKVPKINKLAGEVPYFPR